ncbi:mannosyltransferase family protein [Vibrio variabilis]|uniref:mannosyltransferase family protein n=1 Tax=Vibrio variabilis TaxID=990271 RepID=UPI001EFA284E|nr:mannosyltransferase family protein [Vibrio variabilis]
MSMTTQTVTDPQNMTESTELQGKTRHVDNSLPSLMLSKQQWITLMVAVLLSRTVFYALGLIGTHAYNPETVANIDIWQQVCRFDCMWFQRIADDGYALLPSYMKGGNAANWAFMPVSPLLGKLMALLVGDTNLALVLVSNLTFVLSVVVFLKALKQLSFSEEMQDIAIWLLCFSPYAVYAMSGYSEPLYIALISGVFLACYRQNWWAVGVLGLVAAITRNLGVMLVFSVVIMGFQAYGASSFYRLKNNVLSVIGAVWLIPLGFFSYMAYLHFHMGDALAFGHIQIAWGREFSNPIEWLVYGVKTGGAKLYLVLVSLIGFALNTYLFVKKRYAEAAFMLINLLIPLSSGVNAMPRYIFGLYPTYLAIMLLLERYPKARMPTLLTGAAISTFVAIGFYSNVFFTV